ncbi:ADOP family duplicated permease [Dyella sp. KRB-257]|uniref:ADOP family duplicated permease n=1 Tax=Dyella sp. KRB-257 TaxID=3400915 RepID=UPI003C12B0C3
MNVWLAEIRQAWRASLRKPGFLLLAGGVLALGVGASVAVFALTQNTLWRPLPLPQPSQVMVVGRWNGEHVGTISPRYYQQLAALGGVASIGLKQAGSMANVAAGGEPVQVPRIYADRSLLPTLGLRPIVGRNFDAREDAPGGPPAVLISSGFWQRHYGGDPHVVGRRLRVEGMERDVIGVLPAAFNAVAGVGDVVVPLALPAASNDEGSNYMAVARLAVGANVAAVAAEVDARLHAMDQADAAANAAPRTRYGVERLADWLHRDARPVLLLFQASAVLVLLIALVNLTNLMLLRSLARRHDAAVRGALGASLPRLMLPALGEGLLVGLVGAVLGMALAGGGLALLQGFIPAQWLAGGALHVGVTAWMLALAGGVLAALLAAALGLWRSHSAASVEVLREGGRSGAGRDAGRLGRVLVVGQVALATLLLSAAGLFVHALYDASQVRLGFDGERVLTFELAPLEATYPDAAAVNILARRLVERLRTIPGVTEAAVTTNLPTSTDSIGSFGHFSTGVRVPGRTTFNAQYHGVGPGFFELFAIPLQRGRYFTRGDMRGAEQVAIVSQDLAAARYGGNALGKTIEVEGRGNVVWPARIVGVVGDTWQDGPLQPKQPVLYVPLAQMPAPMLAGFRRFEPLRFVLRGHGNPEDWRGGVRTALAEIAPGQPVANLRTMRSILRAVTADARLNLLLIGVFAALALLLAVAGLYAVMAVAVAAREREFGVRQALGAAPSTLLRLVLQGGLVQVAAGLAVGVCAALGLSRMLPLLPLLFTGLLGRSDAFDPMATLGVCVVLALAGCTACLLPALRAARVAPMRALRGE